MELTTKEYIKNLWDENIHKNNFYNSLYIDIPFCKSYCNYCIYKKVYEYNEENVWNYLKFLKKEMKFFSSSFLNKKISAVHVGGGSPSVLTPDQFKYLVDNLTSLYEVDVHEKGTRTIELNPNYLDDEKIKTYFSSIFNRTTMGIQSFSEDVLNNEGRQYCSPERMKSIVDKIRDVNENININIDLMMGLSGETEESILYSFDQLDRMGVNRITFYINNNIERTEEFASFVKKIIYKLALNDKYTVKSIDGNNNVNVERCHLFFNNENFYTYNYLYDLGTSPTSNKIGFGPSSMSYITNILKLYSRDLKLNFEESVYTSDFLELDSNNILYKAFKTEKGFMA